MDARNTDRKPLILNVDDHEAGRYAISRILRKGGYEVVEAGTGAEALEAALKERPDLLLLDVNLPDISGFEVCRRIKADPALTRTPVVHISASSLDASHRVHGLNTGADSYITEPVEPEVLLATVAAVLRAKRAEDASRELALQWQTTFDAMSDAVALLDPAGRIVRWNRALERFTDRPPEQLSGELWYKLWNRGEEPPEKLTFLHAMERRVREEIDINHWGRWFHLAVDPVPGQEGETSGAVYVVSDITARKRLEEQFREAQKFESIGQLAGGVAHDFNNLLTSVLGNASLILSDLPQEHPFREKLEEVMRASNRAADLTQQLLAYAGKGRFYLRRMDLSSVIREMEGLLRSSIPKKVELELELAEDLPAVEVDPGQIQQALFNLVSNAAEAIGEAPGVVRVSTGTQRIEQPAGDLAPGQYVCLEVRDTGCGMDEHTLAHVFDPFFTTKFTGRGLGLSAVSGILRGHRGGIDIDSAPGKGTRFRLLLPAAKPVPAQRPVTAHAAGSGTVLVVDDEDMVRRLAKTTLEIRGYKVLLAVNGRQAVDIVRESGDRIAVVLLDMMMPVMAGGEAMEHIMKMYPGMRVIATSGYDEREAAQRFGSRIAAFLQKPYTSRQLAEKIKGVLDAAPAAAESGGD